MATADISKQSVFDARIVQHPARFAVDKGALSLTNAPYQAIAATASQMTFNINVPSQNVFVDRAIDWEAEVGIQFTCSIADAAAGGANPYVAGQPILAPGENFAPAAFPLHECVSTMTATINDTSVVINTDSVLKEVLRLTDYSANRISRTCPTMLDRYAINADAAAAINDPLGSYVDMTTVDNAPNGAFPFQFADPNTGQPLVGTDFYTFPGPGGVRVNYVNGIPVRTAQGAAVDDTGVAYPLMVRIRSTEKLVLSPFIFANACEWETGLFGINNIQLVFNFKSSPSRAFRLSGNATGALGGRSLAAIQYGTATPGAWYGGARVNVQYLTPSLDIPLPAKSVVPYMEFPRYIQSFTGQNDFGVGIKKVFNSQTIVLPQIPDMLIIYAKPSSSALQTPAFGDFYLPPTGISLNFDNFAGLLSSHTQQQLYSMAVHNGLEMNFNMFTGKALSGGRGASTPPLNPQIQTVGGFLVLKPGQDFALQSGQAPSLIGNFTLQFNLTVENTTSVANPDINLFVIAVNSGFFETLAGSSRIIKGVLSEADIISAEPVAELSRDGLKRIVGAGFFSSLGSILSKAKDIYAATKPAVSAIKGMLPEGKIKNILGNVGYGHAGAGMDGCGMAGAGMAGAGKHKKSLSQRLM
jgi:hypothetical protein